MLKGQRILLGVTGSIAAYKAVELLRLLTKSGAELQVVMTEAATKVRRAPHLRDALPAGGPAGHVVFGV